MSIVAAPRSPSRAFPISRWATLTDGRAFHYVSAGNDDAPPLVFLHGYTDSWRSFELLIPYLKEHFRLFALDQRGHGATGSDFDGYTIADFTQDAIAFIETVVREPVTIVGHSLGSLIAQRVAATRPDLLQRLILISTADTAGGNPAIADLRRELDRHPGRIPYELARDFQSSTVAKPIAQAQLEVFIQESLRLEPEVWRQVADALADDHAVVAAEIAAPTLVLWGERDGVFDDAAQQRISRLLPRGKLTVYRDVGHAPNWEIPQEVARDIAAFHRA